MSSIASLNSIPLSEPAFWLAWFEALESSTKLDDICGALTEAAGLDRVEIIWQQAEGSAGLAQETMPLDLPLGAEGRAKIWPAVTYEALLAQTLNRGLSAWSSRTRLEERNQLQHSELSQALNHLRQSQNQLLEAEKMAALGRLVQGMAHELNTPIGIGLTALSVLKEDLSPVEAEHDEAMGLIAKQLHKASRLVSRFKQIAVGHSSETPVQFKLLPHLQDIVASLKPRLQDAQISLSLDCASDFEITSYPGAWVQVVSELVDNAICHAWEKNADSRQIKLSVDIETSQAQEGIQALISLMDWRLAHEDDADAPPFAPAPSILVFRCQDNGQGIPQDKQAHLFEPFYTRDKSRFTGLGLHIVYNLLHQTFQGKVEYIPHSEGACFELRLPLS